MKLTDILVKDFNKFFIKFFSKTTLSLYFYKLYTFIKICFRHLPLILINYQTFPKFPEKQDKISIELNMVTHRTVSCGMDAIFPSVLSSNLSPFKTNDQRLYVWTSLERFLSHFL